MPRKSPGSSGGGIHPCKTLCTRKFLGQQAKHETGTAADVEYAPRVRAGLQCERDRPVGDVAVHTTEETVIVSAGTPVEGIDISIMGHTSKC